MGHDTTLSNLLLLKARHGCVRHCKPSCTDGANALEQVTLGVARRLRDEGKLDAARAAAVIKPWELYRWVAGCPGSCGWATFLLLRTALCRPWLSSL
jgi:hypothetical protein